MTPTTLAPADLRNVKCGGIITSSLQKDNGFDDLEQIRRTDRVHNMDSGFFRGEHESTAQHHYSFFDGAVLGGFKACRSLIPVRQPDAAPSPLFDDKAVVIETADKGPIMAISLDAPTRHSPGTSADPLESHIKHLGAQMMAAYARYEASGCFFDIGEAHAYRIQMQRAISQRSPAQVRALEAERGLS